MSNSKVLVIRTPFNSADMPKKYEVNRQKSCTIPNRAMSIKQILDRYASGLPITGAKNIPLYTGEEYLPDLDKMDLSEIHDLKIKIQQRIKEGQDMLAKAEEEKNRQSVLEHAKLLVLQEIEQKQKSTPPAPSAGGD